MRERAAARADAADSPWRARPQSRELRMRVKAAGHIALCRLLTPYKRHRSRVFSRIRRVVRFAPRLAGIDHVSQAHYQTLL